MDKVFIKIYLSFPPLYSSENSSLTYQVLEYNESSPERACIYGEGSKIHCMPLKMFEEPKY